MRSAGNRALHRGVACVMALAVLAILGVIMGTVFAQGLRGHRLADRRIDQLQTLWLARSGVEMAAARLVGEPLYAGEVMKPVPDSLVTVKVQGHGGLYVIRSEGRYAIESNAPLMRRLERRFRLIGASGDRRLDAAGSEL